MHYPGAIVPFLNDALLKVQTKIKETHDNR